MRKYLVCLVVASLWIGAPAMSATDEEKREARRAAIDEMARDALDRLVEENDRAAELFGEATAYAVFDNFKFTLLLSGGGGVGVAVDRTTGHRTYMKMGSGGVGLGVGGQSYQVVFLFEDDDTFRRFVNKGWQANLSANAVAGTSGKNAPATFSEGVVVYQLTHKGLMAAADITGTKYWKHKRLN